MTTQPAAKTLSTMTFQKEYIREIVNGELSIANMLASLLVKIRYDNAIRKETTMQNWAFLNKDFSKYFEMIMETHSEDSNSVLELMTKGWNMDFKTLGEFTDTEVKMKYPSWVNLKWR